VADRIELLIVGLVLSAAALVLVAPLLGRSGAAGAADVTMATAAAAGFAAFAIALRETLRATRGTKARAKNGGER
jgi:4-amino-4-deoxy-L-arabinose transferase-like glycosyltransferase